MQEFNYHRPITITELKECLSIPGARILAGGTDIVPRMRQGKFSVPALVDTSGVKAMRFIEDQGSEIVLGALTTHQEAADSPLLQNINPALVTAAESIGCQQTRCRGTLGGNIANASPAADTLPALLIFDATLLLQSLEGERRIPLEEFLLGPGQTDLLEGEFIHSISFKPMIGSWGAAFIKIGKRSGMAISVANTAVAVELNDKGKISDIRIALGSVAPTVIRCRKIEQALLGKEPEPALMKEIHKACQEEISPITDIRSSAEYRNHAAEVIIHRALESAVEQAKERGR
ncbi:MAG: xanthine dehydrogenase family protein subunit M [Anaerolineales bacterium]|nr:xanthine dehydrogenase family protein subunit M [Anaerolineales bacterium]